MNNKKRLIIIISLLAVLLIAGGISIYFINKNLSDSKTDDDVVEKDDSTKEEKDDDKDDSTKEESDDKNHSTEEGNEESKSSPTDVKKKFISSDADLSEPYQAMTNLTALENTARKVADLYIYGSQFGFNTGTVYNMPKTNIIDMAILLLPINDGYVNTCYKQDYIVSKVNDLFGIKFDKTVAWKSGTVENGYYCTDYTFGAGGNTNPLQFINKKIYEENGSNFIAFEYGYEGSITTVAIEYKLEDGHYVLKAIDKK